MTSMIDRWCKLAVCSLDLIFKTFLFIFCWLLICGCYILCIIADGLNYISDHVVDFTDDIMSKNFSDWKKG